MKRILLQVVPVIVLAGGCMPGPNYIPRSASKLPPEQLARVRMPSGFTYKNVRVDGHKCQKDRYGRHIALLAPGTHTVSYTERTESAAGRKLAALQKKMKEEGEGFTLRAPQRPGLFFEFTDGIRIKRFPIPILGRGTWEDFSVTFDALPGEAYIVHSCFTRGGIPRVTKSGDTMRPDSTVRLFFDKQAEEEFMVRKALEAAIEPKP